MTHISNMGVSNIAIYVKFDKFGRLKSSITVGFIVNERLKKIKHMPPST